MLAMVMLSLVSLPLKLSTMKALPALALQRPLHDLSSGKGHAVEGQHGGNDGAGNGCKSSSWVVDVGSDVVWQGSWWWWQWQWRQAQLSVYEHYNKCWEE